MVVEIVVVTGSAIDMVFSAVAYRHVASQSVDDVSRTLQMLRTTLWPLRVRV